MKRMIATAALCMLALLSSRAAFSQDAASETIVGDASKGLSLSAMTGKGHWELRIYTINRGRLDDFVAAWLEGVYPLRLEQGFKIPAAWVSRANNQFIWILGYDGEESWEDKQRAYYDSNARQSLEVDPLDLIAHGDTWPITPVASQPTP
jgi:hypothetical protein